MTKFDEENLHDLVTCESSDSQSTEADKAETDTPKYRAEDINRTRNTFETASSQAWTSILSSSSSSSSLGDLALKSEDLTAAVTITSQGQFCSSSQLNNVGPLTSSTHSSASQKRLTSPSTVIAEKADAEKTKDQPVSADTLGGCLPVHMSSSSGSDSSLVIVVEEEQSNGLFEEKDFDVTDLRLVHEAQYTASRRNPSIAHILRNAIPLQGSIQKGIEWKNIQYFPTIEEEENSCSSIVRRSSSHDSLLAFSSDEFEYAQVRHAHQNRPVRSLLTFPVVHQYSLSCECSIESGLSEGHVASHPPRPMVGLALDRKSVV